MKVSEILLQYIPATLTVQVTGALKLLNRSTRSLGWNGCSYQSRKKGRTVPFQKLKTLILYRQIAAKDREVFHPGSDTAVRARLNADAAGWELPTHSASPE